MPKQKTKTSTQPSLFEGKSDNGKDKHNTKASLSSLIKSSRDIMRKDAGLNGDLDRLPQLSWILFLKCYDDLEMRREEDAKVSRQSYKPIIPSPYRWRDWASDEDNGATGEDLIKFVNDGLLPALRGLSGSDERLKVAEVFKETYNRMLSGYLLRDVVDLVDNIRFQSKDEIFTLAHLYESMLKEMRDAAGDSGEFYTPRPVVKLIVDRVKPRLGENVLDPACGTGGFLVEAYEYLKPQVKNSKEQKTLQNETLFGVEKKPLPYLLSTMNLLLHGIETPNIRRDNALKNPLNEIGEKDRFDVIVTNPPFGGEEEAGIQLNFPENTRASETALLFMQFIMRSLKRGGRSGVVVPNGFLFGDGVAARIKAQLLRDFNLHTVIRLPNGVFAPYTSIPTNLLFFDRPRTGGQLPATTEIWFYEQPLLEGLKNYSKKRSLQFDEFLPLIEWWDNRVENKQAWIIRASDFLKYDKAGNVLSVNLDIKNPNAIEDFEHMPPEDLAKGISIKEKQIAELIESLRTEVSLAYRKSFQPQGDWQEASVGDFCESPQYGYTESAKADPVGPKFLRITDIQDGKVDWEKVPYCECQEPEKYLLQPNDILFARTGATTGKSFLIRECPEAVFASYLIRLRVKHSVLPEYLYQYFQSPDYWSQITEERTGTGQSNVNGQKLSKLRVPIPPLDEQHRIVDYINGLQTQIEKIHKLQESVESELSLLLSSALYRAFRGEL